ncbi:RNA polymerase sigma factor [Undibacterium sp. Rencai35W]|uniref:RNA polymerase sigma factor n=1 Tax=Undibacterium sp. Rencai35W TaxID=3413046 RepID=UPI003BF3F658
MALADLTALMTDCLPRLRRYARALVADRVLADDLVQDTLERAWLKRAQWRAGGDIRPWLFGIMHNLYVTQVRQGSLQLIDMEQVAEDNRNADGQETVESSTRATQSDRLEMHDLHTALRMLPREQRAVLLLVSLEQMDYKEIALALDIPLGTVMSRLSRGREKLRLLMATNDTPQTHKNNSGTLPTLKVVK